MAEAGIAFAKTALDNLVKLSPSQQDITDITEELKRVLKRVQNKPGGTVDVRVPFDQIENAFLTWVGKWRIVYQQSNPGVYVIHIDDEMEPVR
jgi:hypothetical protein